MTGSFERQLAELRGNPDKLRRAKAQIQHSLSVVAPVFFCLGCKARAMKYSGHVFSHKAGDERNKTEHVGFTYFACTAGLTVFAAADQFSPDTFTEELVSGASVLVTSGGHRITVVRCKPYREGTAPLDFTTKQRERMNCILALPDA